MKNKCIIVVICCTLSIGIYGCQDYYDRTSPLYEVNAVNNTEKSIYVEMYMHEPVGLFTKSEAIEPGNTNKFAEFVISSKVEDRYVFISNVDQTIILDTTVVTYPNMPYDGIDYQINMTVNADHTLTIQTIPKVK